MLLGTSCLRYPLDKKQSAALYVLCSSEIPVQVHQFLHEKSVSHFSSLQHVLIDNIPQQLTELVCPFVEQGAINDGNLTANAHYLCTRGNEC